MGYIKRKQEEGIYVTIENTYIGGEGIEILLDPWEVDRVCAFVQIWEYKRIGQVFAVVATAYRFGKTRHARLENFILNEPYESVIGFINGNPFDFRHENLNKINSTSF